MNSEEFTARYLEFKKVAIRLAAKARREGVLGLAEDIDREQEMARDIFHYGLRFVVDGTATDIIDKILGNLIVPEKDEYARRFKFMQLDAVMGIQAGYGPEILHRILNSYTDLPMSEDDFPLPGTDN